MRGTQTKNTITILMAMILFVTTVILSNILPGVNQQATALTCVTNIPGAANPVPFEFDAAECPDGSSAVSGGTTTSNNQTSANPPSSMAPGSGYSIADESGICWNGDQAQLLGGVGYCPPQPTDNGATAQNTENAAESNAETTAPVKCELSWFGWFVCAVVTALQSLGDFIIQNMIVPFLQTSPIKISDANDNIFKVWSSFRIVANIILVAALLFVIFGNAFGDGFAQAYLAKKSLPRIFIAAILINTSIYIAAGMIDITNVIGKGIGQMMMAPFSFEGAFLFKIDGMAGTTLTLSMIGGAVWGITGGFVPFMLLFVLLPAIVAMLAVFITLVVRQGILLLLVLISPIAFALFALPNTAKYFGKWWDTFLKTLMVYPIVMIVIALSNILAYLINYTDSLNSNPANRMIADLVSIFLMIAPLFIIPFAFKIAGGITGQIFGAVSSTGKKGVEAFKGNPDDPESLRRRVAYGYRSGRMMRRANMIDRLNTNNANGVAATTSTNPFVRHPARALSRLLNTGNMPQMRGKMAEEQKRIFETQTGSGEDSSVRALFAKQWDGPDEEGPKGRKKGQYYGYTPEPDGSYKRYKYSDVQKAREMVGKDPSRLRTFASYEMGKAANDGYEKQFNQRFVEKLNEMGFSQPQADMIWDGVKGDHMGARLERRWTDITGTKGNLQMGEVKHNQLSNDLAHRVRSWDFAGFRSSTAKVSLQGWQEATARINSGQGTANDHAIVDNYEQVARGVQRAFEARSASPGGEGMPDQGAVIRGLGGSARADAAWKNYYETVLGVNQNQGRHTGP